MKTRKQFIVSARQAGAALLVSLLAASPVFAADIDVLVVYNQHAMDWADEKISADDADGCDYILSEHNETSPAGHVISASESIAAAGTLGYIHPCTRQGGPVPQLHTPDNGIGKLITVMLDELNTIYRNSGISADKVNFNLAATYHMDRDSSNKYDEFALSQSMHPNGNDMFARLYGEIKLLKNRNDDATCAAQPAGSYLNCLEDNGLLDKVHAIREVIEADLVVFLIRPPEGATGIGEAVGINVTRAENGFAWVSVEDAIAPVYTFAHEVSHLMGAQHFSLNKLLGIMVVQPDTLNPDYAPGTRMIDNRSDIGINRIGGFEYWGTLLSETSQCMEYTRLRGLDAGDYCNNAGFNDKMLVLPLLSNPEITRTAPGGCGGSDCNITFGMKNYRNNARVVANAAVNVAALSDQLVSDREHYDVPVKYGLDIGVTTDVVQNRMWTEASISKKASDGQPTREYWMNIVSIKSGPATASQDGVVSARVVDSFFSRAHAHPSAQASISAADNLMPVEAMLDGFKIDWKSPGWFDPNPPAIEFSGLQKNGCYHVKVFASTPAILEARKINIAVYDNQAAYSGARSYRSRAYRNDFNQIDESHLLLREGTSANYSRFFDIHNIRPSDGTITLEFMADPDTVGFLETVMLNAVQVFEEPDPGC